MKIDDKTKNTLCLVHHLGVGDFIECNGMVRHFAELYDTVTIFAREMHFDLVSKLYKDTEKIVIHKVSNDNSQHYRDILTFIQGFAGEVKWVGYDAYNSQMSFFFQTRRGPAESFYYLADVPFKYRKEKFFFKRDLIAEEEVFKKLNPDNEEFIFVHDDPIRGFHLEIDSPLRIIRNDPTVDFFSMLGIITKASEIHCMSSSYFCLIDCMGDENFIGKKYYHSYVRDTELFGSGLQGEWEMVS